MQLEVTFGTVKWISNRAAANIVFEVKPSHTTSVTATSWFGLTKTAVCILLGLGLVLRTVRPRQCGQCHEPETKQRDPLKLACVARNRYGRLRLKCDGTRAETTFRLSAKRTSPFKSAAGRQFSRLLAAELCASAVVMLDTPCSEVVWRVLATHSIYQFPPSFSPRASPCAVTIQLDSTSKSGWLVKAYCSLHISYHCRSSVHTASITSTSTLDVWRILHKKELKTYQQLLQTLLLLLLKQKANNSSYSSCKMEHSNKNTKVTLCTNLRRWILKLR